MTDRLAIVFLIACVFATACSDRTRDPVTTAPPSNDDDDVIDAGFDRPVRALCVPGSRRCLAENSPLFEVCSSEGISFLRDACGDGDVCRDSACVTFSCTPGRPLCVGPTTRAVCDSTGRAVTEPTECEGDNACLGGACVDLCEQAADARSYIGCEYVPNELPNLDPTAPFGIVVANTEQLLDARVTVDSFTQVPVVLREKFVLAPSSLYEFAEETELESLLFLADGSTQSIAQPTVVLPPGSSAVFLPKRPGPELLVTSSRPVVAYQFNPYCCNFTATNDASLLLPTSTWGTRYRVLGYPAWRSPNSDGVQQAYLRVVVNEAATITVRSPTELTDRERGDVGTVLQVDMRAGSAATFETRHGIEESPDARSADLSGTLVEADVPVGVFTGHPCTFVPQGQWACDHLEESVFPASTLGSRYVLSPVRRRADDIGVKDDDSVTEATYWRIVADADAEITFDPPLEDLDLFPPSTPATRACTELLDGGIVRLAEGEVCEIGPTVALTADSTAPLAVGGIISGHQSTGTRRYGNQAGDPSLFMLGPIEQFRSDYGFVNPPTFKRTYVTVTAPPGAPITLDSRSIPIDERLERQNVTLAGTQWEVFTVALAPGPHRMKSEVKFGIVVYAFDDYVSYAFTGGLDLLPKGAERP